MISFLIGNEELRIKIEADVNLFKSYLETKGITAEDIGLPDLTVDANYYNKFFI